MGKSTRLSAQGLQTLWQPLEIPNPRSRAFAKQVEGIEQPIFFVLPASEEYIDKELRIADAITTLATVERRETQGVLAEICSSFRNVPTEDLEQKVVRYQIGGKLLIQTGVSENVKKQ